VAQDLELLVFFKNNLYQFGPPFGDGFYNRIDGSHRGWQHDRGSIFYPPRALYTRADTFDLQQAGQPGLDATAALDYLQ
jgi:hypothetical protein